MKKIIRTTAALCAALLLSCPVLTSCEEKIEVNVHLTYDMANDALVSPEEGLNYRFASISYEPAVVADPYADWDEVLLYTVKGWDPAVGLWHPRGIKAPAERAASHSRVQIKVDTLIGGHLAAQGPQWVPKLPKIPAQKLSILRTKKIGA